MRDEGCGMRAPGRRGHHPSALIPHPFIMWNDRLRIAESVEAQWRSLADHERAMVSAALETIDEDPIAGAPLFEPLRGCWSYRAGHLRIIYRLAPEARYVVILSITRAPEFT
jgi:mRNA-degrading endonuclease RelE of RelBE toxin-antitoxin system